MALELERGRSMEERGYYDDDRTPTPTRDVVDFARASTSSGYYRNPERDREQHQMTMGRNYRRDLLLEQRFDDLELSGDGDDDITGIEEVRARPQYYQ